MFLCFSASLSLPGHALVHLCFLFTRLVTAHSRSRSLVCSQLLLSWAPVLFSCQPVSPYSPVRCFRSIFSTPICLLSFYSSILFIKDTYIISLVSESDSWVRHLKTLTNTPITGKQQARLAATTYHTVYFILLITSLLSVQTLLLFITALLSGHSDHMTSLLLSSSPAAKQPIIHMCLYTGLLHTMHTLPVDLPAFLCLLTFFSSCVFEGMLSVAKSN